MNKKNILLLMLGFFCISMYIYVGVSNFNLSLLSNDSGFDTSYDGGGSSSGSGSGSNSGIYDDYRLWGVDGKNAEYIFAGILIALFLILFIAFITMLLENRVKPADREIVESAKKIFEEVQIAWMNFDYDKLRELVTDELYNTYYNQLQTLQLKGQKNIMSDFTFSNIRVLSKNNVGELETIEIKMTVSFIDYIADSSGQPIRGNKYQKVNNIYNLVFVTNNNSIDTCPNCNAALDQNAVTCNYCQTKIQGVRGKMKLSQKRIIR